VDRGKEVKLYGGRYAKGCFSGSLLVRLKSINDCERASFVRVVSPVCLSQEGYYDTERASDTYRIRVAIPIDDDCDVILPKQAMPRDLDANLVAAHAA
jgi:hypothetical protein